MTREKICRLLLLQEPHHEQNSGLSLSAGSFHSPVRPALRPGMSRETRRVPRDQACSERPGVSRETRRVPRDQACPERPGVSRETRRVPRDQACSERPGVSRETRRVPESGPVP
ncbi:hypothetical protein WMY93_030956 [Mugilogobius chulae]|uniref:Uncharacterized protein n=1 Tax=Mugilogobius chulae TaxID=88201 RepID=A0AAW0MNP0_9GOBI